MSADSEKLSKLSGFDRTVISILGLLAILGLGAVLNAPLAASAAAAALYYLSIQIYGRLPRPRDLPDPSLISDDTTAGLFDQRLIADSFSEAVWIINSREQIIYANKAAAALFGPTPFGRRLATVMRDPAITQLVKTVLQGSSTEPTDFHMTGAVERHFRVTGTAIHVEPKPEPVLAVTRAAPAPIEAKLKRFTMLVFYDVTDFVKFARTQGDFLANASHELKTPVASLLGYIETLRGHAKDDAGARERFLLIMQEQAQRMERLISDLLSLRQIEQSEHLAPSAAADMCAAVNFALDTVTPLARARGVAVTLEAPSVVQVRGHQDQLVQLCLNVIDNAVKMSPKGGKVMLELSTAAQWRAQDIMGAETPPHQSSRQIVSPAAAAQGYAVLKISDEGPGFAPNHIPRLGERFYRVAGDRSSREKGTGLGLAIVKHLVLRHRGGLMVTSTSAPNYTFGADILESHAAASSSATFDSTESEKRDTPIQTGTCFTIVIPLHRENDGGLN